MTACRDKVIASITEGWEDPFCTFTHVQAAVDKIIDRMRRRGMSDDEIVSLLTGEPHE
jgi:hypothetical protein